MVSSIEPLISTPPAPPLAPADQYSNSLYPQHQNTVMHGTPGFDVGQSQQYPPQPPTTAYSAAPIAGRDVVLVGAKTQQGESRREAGSSTSSLPRLSSSPSSASSSSSQHPTPPPSASASDAPQYDPTYLPPSLTFLPPTRPNANPDDPAFVQPSYFYPSPYTIDVDEFDGYRAPKASLEAKKEERAREASVASSVATGVDGSAAAEGTAEGGSGEARREGEDDEEIAKAKADRRGAKKWLSPEDDEDCKRGIPVFEPTMEEFADFEEYMTRVDHWGRRAGIVKVIPPKEWIDSLPDIQPEQLQSIKIKSPIQQNMMGIGGLFRQNNIEKKKPLSVEDWLKKCTDPKWAMPSLKDTDRSERPVGPGKKKRKADAAVAASKEVTPAAGARPVEEEEMLMNDVETRSGEAGSDSQPDPSSQPLPDPAPSQNATGSSSSIAIQNSPAPLNPLYNSLIDTHPWLPSQTTPADFTPEACRTLERKFWRQLGMGEPAWYGADLQGTLFTPETETWNVGKLPNLLNRLRLKKQLPGVNTPYLYWGMWRSHFCWHVEDMDLYSVNYLHFGAPKFWYAIPQSKADNFERVMKGYFPNDVHTCSQFLRHKSFAASPAKLALDSLRPNVLVQHKNEFVFTFPRGYHSGFNMGFNCAESINFAIDSWVELGRRAKVCQCVGDSVKIDVDAVIAEHELLTEIERQKALRGSSSSTSGTGKKRGPYKKRALDDPSNPSSSSTDPSSQTLSFKKTKLNPEEKAADKLAKKDAKETAKREKKEGEKKAKAAAAALAMPVGKGKIGLGLAEMPCVLCPSGEEWDLMEVMEVPASLMSGRKDGGVGKVWRAHERCANNVPETYFVDVQVVNALGQPEEVRKIAGVQNIDKARWGLNCAVCTKPAIKKMGGKIQCTKGKCSRAFHVTCALSSPDVVLREIETEEWVEEGPTPEQPYPHKVLKAGINTECLCSAHNPAVKERKKLLAAEKRRDDILTLKPNELVKIKTKQGMIYEVPFVRPHAEEEMITVLWDSKELKVPFAHIVLPEASANAKPLGSSSTPNQPSAYRLPPFFAVPAQRSSTSAGSGSSSSYPSLPIGGGALGSSFSQNIRQTANPHFRPPPPPAASSSSSSRQTPSIAFPPRQSSFSSAQAILPFPQRSLHPPSHAHQQYQTPNPPPHQSSYYLPHQHQQHPLRPFYPPPPSIYSHPTPSQQHQLEQPYHPPTFVYPINMSASSFAPPSSGTLLPNMPLSPAMLELIGKNSVIGSAFANLGWSPASVQQGTGGRGGSA